MEGLKGGQISELLSSEIARFMDAAIKRGDSNLYHNRRSTVRHHRTWPLFVARMDAEDTGDLNVTLRDISLQGIGFLCDAGFPVGCVLGIKLFWSEPNAPRVPAIVRHNQITLEGTFVGAEFAVNDPEACALIEKNLPSWYG